MKLTFPGPLISHVLLSFEEKFHGDDGILFGWVKSKSLHFVLLCKEIEKKKKSDTSTVPHPENHVLFKDIYTRTQIKTQSAVSLPFHTSQAEL